MDEGRTLNHDEDAAIDREIQRMLAIEPSPDFHARVRLQLANTAPSSWLHSLRPVAAMAVGLLTVTAATILWRGEPVSPAGDEARLRAVPQAVTVVVPPAAVSTPVRAGVSRYPLALPALVRRAPRVLVPAEDIASFRWLADGVNQGRVMVGTLAVTGAVRAVQAVPAVPSAAGSDSAETEDEAPGLPPITIEEITITPIMPITPITPITL